MAFAKTALFFMFFDFIFNELCTFHSIHFSSRNTAQDASEFTKYGPKIAWISGKSKRFLIQTLAENGYSAPVAMVRSLKSMVTAAKPNTN